MENKDGVREDQYSDIGNMLVKEIKREHLENCKAKRSEKAKPATVNKEIGAAKAGGYQRVLSKTRPHI